MISLILSLLRFILYPSILSTLETIIWTLQKNVFMLLLNRMLYKCSWGLDCLYCSSLLFLCWSSLIFYPLLKVGCWSHCLCLLNCLFLTWVSFHFINFGTILLSASKFVLISSWWIECFIIIKCPSLSMVIFFVF